MSIDLWTEPASLLASFEIDASVAERLEPTDLRAVGEEVLLIIGGSLDRIDAGVRPQMGWRTIVRGGRVGEWRRAFPDAEEREGSLVVVGHNDVPDSSSSEAQQHLDSIRERGRRGLLLPVLPAKRIAELAPRSPAAPATVVQQTPSFLQQSATGSVATDSGPAPRATLGLGGPIDVAAVKAGPVEVSTEELPRPEELERLIREAEPRAALARASADMPPAVVSNVDGDRAAPRDIAAAVVDETLMVRSPFLSSPKPTGTFRDAMTPVVAPTLTIADYARFRAALRFHGEDDPGTFRLFGVASIAVRDAIQAEFAERFLKNPSAQAEFLTLFERYLRALNSGNP